MESETYRIVAMLPVRLFVDYYYLLPLDIIVVVIIYLLSTYTIKKVVTQYFKQSNRVTEHNNVFNHCD